MRRRAPSLQTVQGGRWGAVLRQGGGRFPPAAPPEGVAAVDQLVRAPLEAPLAGTHLPVRQPMRHVIEAQRVRAA